MTPCFQLQWKANPLEFVSSSADFDTGDDFDLPLLKAGWLR